MTLELEIKDFLGTLGVEVSGIAGPGRFDGPPSLDPAYIMRGAKSIIAFAIPLDVGAIDDFLSKKTAIPHNIDQIRTNQRSMHTGLKLVNFIERKGFRAKGMSANGVYRRKPGSFSIDPRFSHRYGAYVSGIAAPGISGNVVTGKFGAAVVLNTVVTEAVLESDPILDARYFFDDRCQECMACIATCPPMMFMHDEEHYALINGQLYPRGKVRDIRLCDVSCSGMHALSANKKWSSWGKTWLQDWVGVEPDPEVQDVGGDLLNSFFSLKDLGARLEPVYALYSKPWEEGLFEDPKRFPDYEDLAGETEGQKLRSYADVLEKILGIKIADPISMSCGHCALVCGPSAEESQNRWKKLVKSGILAYAEGNEPVIFHEFEEAAAQYEHFQYEIPQQVKKEFWGIQIRTILKTWGIDFHTLRHKKRYKERLAVALAEKKDGSQ